jgi:hypothetical protein
MSATTRHEAITVVPSWKSENGMHPQSHSELNHLRDAVEKSFGNDVFTERVMQQRLPKEVFKRLQRTIKLGEPLDAAIADVVAAAMKDWAVENGATHYTHWFQPVNGPDGGEARRVHRAGWARRRDQRVYGRGARAGRAGREFVPVGRAADDV